MTARIAQVSRTDGQACGIAYFARRLHEELCARGFAVETVDDLGPCPGADVVVLQHHPELFDDSEVRRYCRRHGVPVVVLGHEPGIERFRDAAGLATLAPGSLPVTDRPTFGRLHPAWFPARLADRDALRRELGLPVNALIVGTSGHLRFEREFPAIVRLLLPVVVREGWYVHLATTPWKKESPGLVDALQALAGEATASFSFTTERLSAPELNARLQACDVLWSWTRSPSRRYASGALADQYASGTRVVAARKLQYEPVLALPNTVPAPSALAPFVEALIAESRAVAAARRRGEESRHDPGSVGWDPFVRDFSKFLADVLGSRRSA